MLTKSIGRARTARLFLLMLLLSGCRSSLPWQNEGPNEVNLAFTLEKNVIYLTTAQINGRAGRYVFASAAAKTALDPALVEQIAAPPFRMQLSARDTLTLSPVVLPLGGVAEAVIGADAWGSAAVTIDYRVGLLTYQMDGIHPDYMSLFRFDAEPTIIVQVNGEDIPAIVDTSSPDTLVLPRRTGKDRGRARVAIAGSDFGEIDIGLAETTRARVGNRLLSKFLVTIDYGKRQVGLWRDSRIN
jgi:hypothetical protein